MLEVNQHIAGAGLHQFLCSRLECLIRRRIDTAIHVQNRNGNSTVLSRNLDFHRASARKVPKFTGNREFPQARDSGRIAPQPINAGTSLSVLTSKSGRMRMLVGLSRTRRVIQIVFNPTASAPRDVGFVAVTHHDSPPGGGAKVIERRPKDAWVWLAPAKRGRAKYKIKVIPQPRLFQELVGVLVVGGIGDSPESQALRP